MTGEPDPLERFKGELRRIWETDEIAGQDAVGTTRARYAWSALAIAKLSKEIGLGRDMAMRFVRAFGVLHDLDRGISHPIATPRRMGRGNKQRPGDVWEARANAVIAFELYRAAGLSEAKAAAKFKVHRSGDLKRKALGAPPIVDVGGDLSKSVISWRRQFIEKKVGSYVATAAYNLGHAATAAFKQSEPVRELERRADRALAFAFEQAAALHIEEPDAE